MQKKDAKKLHNRDEVKVKTEDGWDSGYVLGEPKEVLSRIIIPVQTQKHGWIEVDHSDVR